MPFPTTPRYFINFRNSDTGLTPTFVFFKRADTFAPVSAPAVTELSNGRYYFDWTWAATTDPDLVFQVDAGSSIPTEEVRYVPGYISPQALFVDEPISQVHDDVWNDTDDRSVGTKGDFVEHVGIQSDAVDASTVFGKLYKARDAIMGGTGFGGTGVDVKTTYDRVGAPLGGFTDIASQIGDPSGANSIAQDIAAIKGVVDTINTETDAATIADAVWDASTTGNVGSGTMGGLLDAAKTAIDAVNIETDAASIADAVWDVSTTGNVGGGTMGGLLDAAKTAIDAINIETDAASIADAVWDASTTGNVGAGTMGGLLDTAAVGTAPSAATVAAAVWNEATSTHTVVGSFGQTLQLEDSGLATGGAASTITLKAGASAVTDFYKNGLITVTSGTGTGQARAITAYDGGTKIATVDRAWGTNPVSGDGYIVLPAAPSGSAPSAATVAAAVWDEALSGHVTDGSFGSTLQLLTYGQAVASGASDITLAVGSSAVNDFYKNALLVIVSGPGVGQARSVTGYVGTTKVATVDRPWGATVTSMSHYMVIPAANTPVDSGVIAGAVWDVAIASHLTAGSTGATLNSGGTPYVQFKANGDTDLPIIVQVASPTHTTVRVTYSEPVVMTAGSNGALNISNYSIPGLTITGIASLTSQQVLLTTSAQTPNFLYSLTVINVEDTQGNPIA